MLFMISIIIILIDYCICIGFRRRDDCAKRSEETLKQNIAKGQVGEMLKGHEGG